MIRRPCCGKDHGGAVQCPDGLVMCCLCFSRVEVDRLSVDDEGHLWDVCKPCDAAEKRALALRGTGQ